jgi:hypothetical protein
MAGTLLDRKEREHAYVIVVDRRSGKVCPSGECRLIQLGDEPSLA